MEPNHDDAHEQYFRSRREAADRDARIARETRTAAERRTVELIAKARNLGRTVAKASAEIDYAAPNWQMTNISVPRILPDNRLFSSRRRARNEMLHTVYERQDTLSLLLGPGGVKPFAYEDGYARHADEANRLLLLPDGLIVGGLNVDTVNRALEWLHNYELAIENYSPTDRE